MTEETTAKLAAIKAKYAKPTEVCATMCDFLCPKCGHTLHRVEVMAERCDGCGEINIDYEAALADGAKKLAEMPDYDNADISTLLGIVDDLTRERDEATERLGRVMAIGDIEGQASAWAAVWEKLWAAGMCSFMQKDLAGGGRARALEFIDRLTAERDAAAAKEREKIADDISVRAVKLRTIGKIDVANELVYVSCLVGQKSNKLRMPLIERGDCDAGKGAGWWLTTNLTTTTWISTTLWSRFIASAALSLSRKRNYSAAFVTCAFTTKLTTNNESPRRGGRMGIYGKARETTGADAAVRNRTLGAVEPESLRAGILGYRQHSRQGV